MRYDPSYRVTGIDRLTRANNRRLDTLCCAFLGGGIWFLALLLLARWMLLVAFGALDEAGLVWPVAMCVLAATGAALWRMSFDADHA